MFLDCAFVLRKDSKALASGVQRKMGLESRWCPGS